MQMDGGDGRASSGAGWGWSGARGPGAGWGVPGGADRFSWPAFSAGAARVAAFRAEGEGDAGAHLVVLDCAPADEQEARFPGGGVPAGERTLVIVLADKMRSPTVCGETVKASHITSKCWVTLFPSLTLPVCSIEFHFWSTIRLD